MCSDAADTDQPFDQRLRVLALTALELGDNVAAITVRNLDDDVQRRLKLRAAAHNRSMEAEVRAILSDAVRGGDFAASWLAVAERFRATDLPMPVRSPPRGFDLS